MRKFKQVEDWAKKTVGDVTLPTRATKHSVAYDLHANTDYCVKPNGICKIWTDIKAEMETDDALVLNVRSSMGCKFILANTQGWVESDYYSNPQNDGNLGVFLLNISKETQYIKKGDRICQGMFIKYLITDDDIVTNERIGGFGSTNNY